MASGPLRACAPHATAEVYDSAQRPPPFWEELVAAWRYRDLVVQLVARDLKVRYKGSAFGVAWTMLNPLMMMVVLTIVFSHFFSPDLPNYPVYMLSGFILWTFFSFSTTAAMNQLIAGRALLKRIYVPRTLLALTAVGTGLVNLGLSLLPLAAIMLATGTPVGPGIVWILPAVVLAALFTLGLGLLLSTLTVFFLDVVEMYRIVLSIWYFLTPILYPVRIVPEHYQVWLYLNPMYYLVDVFRAPIYHGVPPAPDTLLAATLASLGMLLVGWLVFAAYADQIPYRL